MSNPMLGQNIVFVGAGQITEALIGGIMASRLCRPEQVRVTDPDVARLSHLKKLYGIEADRGNREGVLWSDIVILAVKPQVADGVLKEIGDAVTERLMISVVGGCLISRILAVSGQPLHVVRAMPNTPATVREGMTAFAIGPDVQEQELRIARQIFESVGKVVLVEERLMDAVTGLSGSGPAYVFLAIEALTDGGVKMGLPRETAGLLAAQTVLGAARMVLETGQHPARLKDQVASPAGTTITGLHRLEQGGLRATFIDAVEAATKRSQELGH